MMRLRQNTLWETLIAVACVILVFVPEASARRHALQHKTHSLSNGDMALFFEPGPDGRLHPHHAPSHIEPQFIPSTVTGSASVCAAEALTFLLEQGHRYFPQGTRLTAEPVTNASITNPYMLVMTVSLSRAFLSPSFWHSRRQARLAVNAVVDTAAQFLEGGSLSHPRVRLLIEGRPVPSIGGVDVSGPLRPDCVLIVGDERKASATGSSPIAENESWPTAERSDTRSSHGRLCLHGPKWAGGPKDFLIPLSTRLANTAEWKSYAWRTDREMLFFTNADRYGHFLAARNLDIVSGRAARMVGLSHALANTLTINFTSLSPDCRWMTGTEMMNRFNTLFSLDGRRQEMITDGGMQIVWTPDSRFWINVSPDFEHPSLWHMDENSPVTDEHHLFDVRGVGGAALDAANDMDMSPVIGWTSHGTVIVPALLGSSTGGCQEFYEFAMRPGAVARKFSLPMPMGARVTEMALTPHGGRLAWLLDFAHSDRRQAWEALWVSTVGGGGMHEVGRLPLRSGWTRVEGLDWTPDGRRISFVWRNALYVVTPTAVPSVQGMHPDY